MASNGLWALGSEYLSELVCCKQGIMVARAAGEDLHPCCLFRGAVHPDALIAKEVK
jgi:hypothetical protein